MTCRGRIGAIVTLCFLYVGLAGSTEFAQRYRGEAVSVSERTGALEFSRLRFLTMAFGREGPMDAPLRSDPVMGREYFVEADLFGIESVSSIRFELVDAAGRSLQILTMWKASDSSTDGEFYGFVTVPNQPFRAAVVGTASNGSAVRAESDTLFQPDANGPPDQSILPPGLSPDQTRRIQTILNDYRQQLREQADRAAAEHPGGVIELPRVRVSPFQYQPLTSASGSFIGMHLRYSIQFPSTQTIAAIPRVFPRYSATTWRGMVTMRPLNGTISPSPRTLGVESLQDVIVYQAPATYQGGTTYTFDVSLVPDFVFQGTGTGRFCLYEQKFTNQEVWSALIASDTPVPYSIAIPDTGTTAEIPAFLPQRTFYESFKAQGAFDCGPSPNVRF